MTNTNEIVVYGASGHGKVVADILSNIDEGSLAGFVDDRRELSGTTVMGKPVLGDGEWLLQPGRSLRVALGIGDNQARRRVAARCAAAGVDLVTAIHPSAVVASTARIGLGTVVMAGAAINPDADVGSAAIINTGAVVEHDVVVGEFAHMSPNAAAGGAARIGSLAHLGLGAVVLPLVTIGDNTIVGAGAVVNRDLPANVVAVGVPARVIRQLRGEELPLD